MPFFGRRRPLPLPKSQENPMPQAPATPDPTAHSPMPPTAVRNRALPLANGATAPPVAPPAALPTKRALPVVPASGARNLSMPGGPSATVARAQVPRTLGMERPAATPTEEAIRRAVATVQEPEIGRALVEMGMVKELTVRELAATGEGQDAPRFAVRVAVELATPGDELRARVEGTLRTAIMEAAPEVTQLDVRMTAQVRAANSHGRPGLAGVKNTIAIASGKGGVGKSTVTVNLAIALALAGAKVGLLDADVYGPSMPLMLDLQGQQPQVRTIPSAVPGERGGQRLIPLEAHGIKVISIGFLTDPDKAVIWRGPMASQLINQFINDVDWGELDYLLIDMPPGTGDIHLTLTQRLPLSGAVIVTTPQDVALADAVKGLQMFQEVQVPILGIIENMSYFVCPGCGERTAIFGEGGGESIAERYNVPLVGQIPLARTIREAGDSGQPIVIADAHSPQAAAFRQSAQAIASRLSLEASLTGGRRSSGPLIQIKRSKAGE